MKKFTFRLLTFIVLSAVLAGVAPIDSFAAKAVAEKTTKSVIAKPVVQAKKPMVKLPVVPQQALSASAQTTSHAPNFDYLRQNANKTNNIQSFSEAQDLNSDIIDSIKSKKRDLSSLAKLKDKAVKRKAIMLDLAKKDPQAFLKLAIAKQTKKDLPTNVQPDVESETIISGKLKVLHVDDFKHEENSHFEYTIKSGGREVPVYFTQPLSLRSDATVKISGFALENLAVANTANLTVLETAPDPESVGDQKTLGLLITFLDSGVVPFTKEQAQDIIFNSQFQNFYKEQSYNKVSFSGDAIGWITMQKNGTDRAACLGVNLSDQEVKNYIFANNINLANYGRVVFFMHNPNMNGGCSFVGKFTQDFNGATYRLSTAWVGNITTYNQPSFWGTMPFTWTNLDFVLSHEMGHSLGVMHSNGWDCGTVVLRSDNCYHIEYGNYYDTMGYGNFSLHFNAFYKEVLGWITPDSIVAITSPGRYTINPLEVTGSVKKAAKIQMPNSSFMPFYLEYRKAVGFDSNLSRSDLSSNQSGLFVNYIVRPENGYPFPRLLDTTPTADDWYEDIQRATLNTVSSTPSFFTDPGTGITIGPVVAASNGEITFDVAMGQPQCLRFKPSINLIGFSQTVVPVVQGSSGYFYIDFINTDSLSCGSSQFEIVPVSPPAGWTFRSTAGQNPIAPESNGSASISFTPSATQVPPGTYTLRFDLVNIISGLKVSYPKPITIIVAAPPFIREIIPAKGPVGSEIVLNGDNLNVSKPSVSFLGQLGYAYPNITVGLNNSLRFTVPAELSADESGNALATPPGTYVIQVETNGTLSNSVNFIVTSRCERFAPVIEKSSVKSVAQGGWRNLSLTFKNKDTDGCDPSRFGADIVSSPDWNIYIYPDPEENVASGESGSIDVDIFVPDSTTLGAYPFNLNLVNRATGLSQPFTITINVVAKPVTSSIVPVKGLVNTEVTINGEGFDDPDLFLIFYRSTGYFYLSATRIDSHTVKFTVPSEIYSYGAGAGAAKLESLMKKPLATGGGGGITIPTPLGNYSVFVHTNGAFSNSTSFEVVLQDTTPPKILSWQSIANHNGTDIGLDIADENTYYTAENIFEESRSSGIQKLVITFDEPIKTSSITPDSVKVFKLVPTDLEELVSAPFSSVVSGNTLTVTLNNKLADGERYHIKVSGITDLAGNIMEGDNDRYIGAFVGNVKPDNIVNILDASLLISKFGQVVDANTARFDINLDGVIDQSGDFTVLKSNWLKLFPVTTFVNLTSLNSGENLQTGKTQTITWQASPSIKNVNILLGVIAEHTDCSLDPIPDSCITYVPIATATPNTGSFDWVVGTAGGQNYGLGKYIINVAWAKSAKPFTIVDLIPSFVENHAKNIQDWKILDGLSLKLQDDSYKDIAKYPAKHPTKVEFIGSPTMDNGVYTIPVLLTFVSPTFPNGQTNTIIYKIVQSGNKFSVYRNADNEVIWNESGNYTLSKNGMVTTVAFTDQVNLKYVGNADRAIKETYVSTQEEDITFMGLKGHVKQDATQFLELDSQTGDRIYGEDLNSTTQTGDLGRREGTPILTRYLFKNDLATYVVGGNTQQHNYVVDHKTNDTLDFYITENIVDGNIQSYTISKLVNGRDKGDVLYTVTSGTGVSIRSIVENHEAKMNSLDAITKPLACGSFGDVNADGVISKDDLDLTRSFVLAIAVPTDAQKHDADVNSDSKISSLDTSLINAYRLDRFSTLPACDTAQVSITQFSGQNEAVVMADSIWSLSAQGSDNTIRLTYRVDWGDGSTIDPISVNGGLFNINVTHQYANAGTYTVTAKVNNLNSSSDSKTATVVVLGSVAVPSM